MHEGRVLRQLPHLLRGGARGVPAPARVAHVRGGPAHSHARGGGHRPLRPPAKLDDLLDISCWISERKRASFRFAYEIENESREVVARGTTLHACWDPATSKMIALPAWLLAIMPAAARGALQGRRCIIPLRSHDRSPGVDQALRSRDRHPRCVVQRGAGSHRRLPRAQWGWEVDHPPDSYLLHAGEQRDREGQRLRHFSRLPGGPPAPRLPPGKRAPLHRDAGGPLPRLRGRLQGVPRGERRPGWPR